VSIEPLEVSFKNNWDKPIHRWYRFHAGCSSEFPEKMIDLLRIEKGSTVLDPFVGSGTILICAKERGINSMGFDINPFYLFIAGVKTCWEFDMDWLFEVITSLTEELRILFKAKMLGASNQKPRSKIDNIPRYIWRYFSPEVLEQLSILKEKISEIEARQVRDLLLFALASILVEVSKVHYVGETIVFDKVPKKNEVPVHEVYVQKIWEMYLDLKTKENIRDKGYVKIERGDIRDLDKLVPDKSVDHVITHPPYLNNYNYLLHDRLPLYFLDYFKTPLNERKLRDLIIGSVTKNKVTQNFIPVVDDVEKIAQRIEKFGDIERCKAVLEYFDTMESFLEMLFQKLRRNGYCAMLLGNSYVRGVMIPLDILMSKIARKIGFQVVDVCQVRDRGDGAFQHLYNGKLYESIVLLKRV